ncbi:MAG: tripartite tricarboxylate transporter substrate binding protein, partial [Burkholderiales bacterium]
MYRFMLAALAAVSLVTTGAMAAESYPSRPIRVIVPFPPGGNVDTFARVLYRYVEQDLGQSIIIDNR